MTFSAPGRGIFRSPGMQLALRAAREAVSVPGGVLLCGEVGTGRETLARAIHQAATGPRDVPLEQLFQTPPSSLGSLLPFVVADCAAAFGLESLLFGRAETPGGDGLERASTEGLIVRARGGTLFLRSVQEMPTRVQSRLARVLRNGEVLLEDKGASRVVAVGWRVMASIDSSPAAEADPLVPELGKRLATYRIELPALRRRREDFPALVRLLLAELCDSQRLPVKSASLQAISLLRALPWWGNLNELRALLQTLVLTVSGRTIRMADVLASVQLGGKDVTLSTGGTLKEARERFERDYVAAVLEQHEGRMADAAKALGIQRANLYRKVRQLGVRRKALALRTRVPPRSTPGDVVPDRLRAGRSAYVGSNRGETAGDPAIAADRGTEGRSIHTRGRAGRRGTSEDDSMEIL